MARSFNPLCVGAGLQTLPAGNERRNTHVSIPSVSGRVFRLHRIPLSNDTVVSIPSVSGRVFRHQRHKMQVELQEVSIPSVSGRVFRPGSSTTREPRIARFQSPLCRGGSSDQPRHGRPQGRVVVSIPSVSGRVFRRRSSRRSRSAWPRFQSPLCRGGSSDYADTVERLAAGAVSIPSVSGRVFRRGAHTAGAVTKGRFNPLCVGAGLQTRLPEFWLRSIRKFQSPLCRGGSSDRGADRCGPGRSMFQSPLCRGGSSDRGPPGAVPGVLPVSIPSVSGRVFRRDFLPGTTGTR